MANTYDYVDNDGITKTTTTYTCEAKDMQYTQISEEIKADFDFLLKQLPDKLDDALTNRKSASDISDAFYVEGSSKYSDLVHVYEEIQKDINNIKSSMSTLHERFMTSIDNVNAELGNNFGHWAFCKVNQAGKKVEQIETSDN